MIGKTTLIVRLATDRFEDQYYINNCYQDYQAYLRNEMGRFTMYLWDTAGQMDYDRLRPLSYPDTDVFLLAFNLDNEHALETKDRWLSELHHFNPETPILLVGTKSDLREEDQSGISQKRGEEMAVKMGCVSYVETSSLSGQGINELRHAIVETYVLSHLSKSVKKAKKCLLQ